MAEIEIRVTDIITIEQTQYRVIGYRADLFSLCEMNIQKLNIFLYPAADLIGWIQNGSSCVERTTDSEPVTPKHESTEYKKRKELLHFVVQNYGPMYESLCNKAPKPELYAVAQSLDILPNTMWRTIRKYLQSGFDMLAVVDGRAKRRGKRAAYAHTKKADRPPQNGLGKGLPLTDETLF